MQVMKEVLTIAGPTPDPAFTDRFPNARKEWCINSAVVDPASKSVLANSEDGKLYRWDLTTNTLSQVVTLTPGLGEAYTPTWMGPDGTVYAINNATLFAVGKSNKMMAAAAFHPAQQTLHAGVAQPSLAGAVQLWQAAGLNTPAPGSILVQTSDPGATSGMASGHTLWLDTANTDILFALLGSDGNGSLKKKWLE
jgi:hypothetical protein